MRLSIEPTEKIVELRGFGSFAKARVWQGVDEHGAPVHCYVVRVGVSNDLPAEVHERFGAALQEVSPMREDTAAIPLRCIL